MTNYFQIKEKRLCKITKTTEEKRDAFYNV